ncbi:MAG: plasma-membrane proton-efflux P-type ATPase [Peptococcaceae bacterium]|jgi:H+-transporting ATPase|nr:plasma-membrane proton-efflux P-type ATPase [Peptococcaceae bacterium]
MATADEFQKLSLEECVAALEVDPDKGLRTDIAAERVKAYGYNEVVEKKVSPIIRFIKRFWGLTPWMLEITIILCIILNKYLDMYMISALLLLNAILGFAQEHRAANAIETLKQKLKVNSRVLRDGNWLVLPARDLVPGDVVRVRGGDFIPADLKILKGDLEIDQSALTGESLTVAKGKEDTVYSGSIVKSGEANTLVVLTGTKTYFGRTAELVQVAKPKLHSEAVIAQVVKWLLVMVALFIAAALAVSALSRMNALNMAPLMLILLVSAIPVALPAMFTISMAIGSLELVRRGVLITRLNASEDAAGMDTLCADKTGTITMNQLTVAGVLPFEGFTEEDVVRFGALASQEANRDPIDMAFLHEASNRGIDASDYRQTEFLPFDPKTRRTECVIEHGGETFRVIKGSVSVIAGLTNMDAASLEAGMTDYARRGFRTLAVAVDRKGEPVIAGLIALYDKPRPDAKDLIRRLGELGVAVKMLTGDALPIAREIGAEVGLGTRITRIGEVEAALETDPLRAAAITEESNGFAEIYPEDKYALVKALQMKKHIVGMTGDGVNDGPALKQAEVGIAVSSATDVAKAAASAVLTSEGLGNIVDLVTVGRKIYERIHTWLFNKVVKTLASQIFVIVAFFLTGQFVVSAFDMVLLLLLTDFITLTISTDNTRWSRKPNVWNINNVVRISVIIGAIVTVESLSLLYLGMGPLGMAGNMAALHTFSFAILFYFGTVNIFVVRERGRFWQSFPSRALLGTVGAEMILVAVLTTVGMPGLVSIPLSYTLAVVILCLFFALVVNDPVKYRLLNRRPRPAREPAPAGRSHHFTALRRTAGEGTGQNPGH